MKTKIMMTNMILLKIIAFTWKTFFFKIKQIYSIVVKSMMTYTSMIWHKSTNKLKNEFNEKLLTTQNKYLKTMTDTFKITSIRMLNM